MADSDRQSIFEELKWVVMRHNVLFDFPSETPCQLRCRLVSATDATFTSSPNSTPDAVDNLVARSVNGTDLCFQRRFPKPAVRISRSTSTSNCRSKKILRFLLGAVMGRPRLTIVVALLVLVALAATMTYTCYLVVGVLAEYLDTSRFLAGLLLGAVLARFPWIGNGKLRIVGLLPKPVRRPLITSLLALCLLRFATQGDVVSAMFAGFTLAFVLGFSWLRKLVFGRISSVVNVGAGRNASVAADSTVIDGEFREMKD